MSQDSPAMTEISNKEVKYIILVLNTLFIHTQKDAYDSLERKIPLTLTPFWVAIGISEDINSW